MYEKYKKLKEILASYKSLLVAFSGGVDSTFLLKVAHEVLGNNLKAITIVTPYMAKNEIKDAKSVAKELGVEHIIFKKLWIESIVNNPKDRCYLCKQDIFTTLKSYAKEHCISMVADGSNLDDTKEYRPGRKALKELDIAAPLIDANLTKNEIRALSKELNLSTWDKPSRPCLLTRFPYGELIDDENLWIVEQAEEFLIKMGFPEIRVRYDNKIARIEMPKQEQKDFLNQELLEVTCNHFKMIGFLHVTLDLEPYRHNSLAESILIGELDV